AGAGAAHAVGRVLPGDEVGDDVLERRRRDADVVDAPAVRDRAAVVEADLHVGVAGEGAQVDLDEAEAAPRAGLLVDDLERLAAVGRHDHRVVEPRRGELLVLPELEERGGDAAEVDDRRQQHVVAHREAVRAEELVVGVPRAVDGTATGMPRIEVGAVVDVRPRGRDAAVEGLFEEDVLGAEGGREAGEERRAGHGAHRLRLRSEGEQCAAGPPREPGHRKHRRGSRWGAARPPTGDPALPSRPGTAPDDDGAQACPPGPEGSAHSLTPAPESTWRTAAAPASRRTPDGSNTTSSGPSTTRRAGPATQSSSFAAVAGKPNSEPSAQRRISPRTVPASA